MKNPLHKVSYMLLWVGGLNWGLIGLFNLDLVQLLFGPTLLTRLVYILVGLSAAYSFSTHMTDCKICSAELKKKK